MHDASEYLIGDMPKPAKADMPDYCRMENRIDRCIRRKYGLPLEVSDDVKRVDARMVATEASVLMKGIEGDASNWWADRDVYPEPYPIRIHPWLPELAMNMFLLDFETYSRGVLL